MKLRWHSSLPLLTAAVIAALGAATLLLLPDEAAPWRDRALDSLVLLLPEPAGDDIMVVDIGLASETGARWSRPDTARLMAAIAQQQPAAVALDIVLNAECTTSPDNTRLIDALGTVPTTLGFLLAASGTPPLPKPYIAAGQGLSLPGMWRAAGAEHACPSFEAVAASSAAASLAGGMDATIRHAPALVLVGDTPYLGLAADAVRLAKASGSAMLGGNPAWLRLFGLPVEIGPTATLRFRPSTPPRWQARTVDALAVINDPASASRLKGKIVFVGSSVPGAGALRATATSPVHPSVQIHADLAAGLLAGSLPRRLAAAPAVEAGATLVGAGLAGLFGVTLAPLLAGVLIIGLALAWVLATAAIVMSSGALFDPVAPVFILALSGLSAILVQAARTRRAETALRRRIGQLLPPDVVARFVREPDLLRLEGEERQVTALFTDIEGFTQSLQGIEPRQFVRILDAYFTGMTRIVLDHGGMIDKLVGDAVHALFNAPTDLDHHVDKAIECAGKLHQFAEQFRLQPDMQSLNFGRTRIGIETGMVILGDVGAADKIDYTAHGAAINMAARLEEANKLLGTSICIGPAAAALATTRLEQAGTIALRGFGDVAVFAPVSTAPP